MTTMLSVWQPFVFSEFQGHAAKKLVNFDPNLVFLYRNSSLNQQNLK